MSPGAVSTAITVGSVGRGDRRSSFSNLGSCVDMWAPGESIVSAGIEGATSTRQLSGTSQAAPHVAGAAAMLLEQRPRLTPEEVSQQLLSHATLVNVEGVQRSAASDNLLFTGFMTLPGDPQHTDSMAPPTHAPPCVECSQFDGSVLPGYNSSTVHIALGSHEGTILAWLRGGRADVDVDLLLYAVRPPPQRWCGWWSVPTCDSRPSWLPLDASLSDSRDEALRASTSSWAPAGHYALRVQLGQQHPSANGPSPPHPYRLWTAWRENATSALRPLPVSLRQQ